MTRLEEVAIKEQRLRQLMDATGMSGILLKKQANFSWLTAGGYNMVGIATEIGMTSLLLTKTARYVITNRTELQRMLVEEGLEELGFQPLEYDWYTDAEITSIKKIIPDLDKIGADMDFSGAHNMDGIIKQLRFSLTVNEIERYRFLGDKLSIAFERNMLEIRPGNTECEIAGRFGADLWKDRIDITAMIIAADERIFAYRHPIPTQKPVNRYLLACVNARYKGLITSITRLMHFGEPSPALSTQFAQNLEIENRMIAATQVGKPMSEVFRTAVQAYQEFGYPDEWNRLHQGGAMGYYSRDIKVTHTTPDIVQKNQAFCWNPSITGTKTEDGFIATPEGPVMITHPAVFPRVEQEINGIQFVRPGILTIE